jgi:Family of unknown function (DUF5762)
MERIYYEDIQHFFTKDNYTTFFPSKEQKFEVQLNSILRLTIYFCIITFLIKHDPSIFMAIIFVGIFIYFIYETDTKNKKIEKFYLEKKNLRFDNKINDICQYPTQNNPFMNVLISDYSLNPNKRKACDVSDNQVKEEIKKYFDNNLYRSVSDIFDKEASDRQFISNPSTTIPNDRETFAKWLYKTSATCKENNGFDCYKNLHHSLSS